MQLNQTPSRYEPVRQALIGAGKEILRFAIEAQTRPEPARFGADGRTMNRPIDSPPDPRTSYQTIVGCPWCQVNLRLAGIVYVLDRATKFAPGTGAYLQMARNELVSVRAMIAANPGEIRALENELGQIQFRLIAQDPDIDDLLRSVSHLMDVCTRAAETPHSAPNPAQSRTPGPTPTAERIYGTNVDRNRDRALASGRDANGSTPPGELAREPGASPAS